jgi:type I restriction enzyme, S subunit
MSQQELELPQGWVEIKLNDIAIRLQAGGTPSTRQSAYYQNGTIPFVKIDDITNSDTKYLETTKVKITKQGLDDSSAWLVPENSLLYSMYASYGLPIINKIKVATSQAIIVYQQPQDLISLDFVYYFLKFMGPFSTTKGTTQKNLNAGIVKNYKVLLPPLNEQKRIVSKIEEIFSKIDSAKLSLEYTKLQLEQYRQSLLKSAFEGKHTEQWESVKLESITEKIENTNPKDNPDHKFKYCDIASIDNTNHIIVNPKNFLGKDAPSRARQIIHQEDVIFSTVRTYLHNFAIVPSELNNQLCSTGFCVLRGTDSIITKLIFYLVQTIQFENYLNPLQRGTSYPAVRNNDILNYKFLLPALKEQEQIVSQIEQGFSLIENTTQIIESTLQKLQTMKMSVLKQAFEGKLVPQDPNDEPASVLLERIKSTKESQNTKQRGMKNVK